MAGAQFVVHAEFDGDGAHEVVPLLACVLANGFDQLGAQRVFDVCEPGVVGRREHHGEVVGDDPLALDVDRAMVVHLPDEAPAELDRTNGVA